VPRALCIVQHHQRCRHDPDEQHARPRKLWRRADQCCVCRQLLEEARGQVSGQFRPAMPINRLTVVLAQSGKRSGCGATPSATAIFSRLSIEMFRASFNMRYKSAVQSCLQGKHFLRPVPLPTQAHDVHRKYGASQGRCNLGRTAPITPFSGTAAPSVRAMLQSRRSIGFLGWRDP
jgi:hypothetical protein